MTGAPRGRAASLKPRTPHGQARSTTSQGRSREHAVVEGAQSRAVPGLLEAIEEHVVHQLTTGDLVIAGVEREVAPRDGLARGQTRASWPRPANGLLWAREPPRGGVQQWFKAEVVGHEEHAHARALHRRARTRHAPAGAPLALARRYVHASCCASGRLSSSRQIVVVREHRVEDAELPRSSAGWTPSEGVLHGYNQVTPSDCRRSEGYNRRWTSRATIEPEASSKRSSKSWIKAFGRGPEDGQGSRREGRLARPGPAHPLARLPLERPLRLGALFTDALHLAIWARSRGPPRRPHRERWCGHRPPCAPRAPRRRGPCPAEEQEQEDGHQPEQDLEEGLHGAELRSSPPPRRLQPEERIACAPGPRPRNGGRVPP